MSDSGQWDGDHLVARALDQIVIEFGREALADQRTLENRLSDVLPQGVAPRERNLVLAASKHGLHGVLEQAISQGLAATTAVRYATDTLHEVEAFELSACEWVAAAFARALGHPPEP
jgi:hypothetical protein